MSGTTLDPAHIDYLVQAAIEAAERLAAIPVWFRDAIVTPDNANELGTALYEAHGAYMRRFYPATEVIIPSPYTFDPYGLPAVRAMQTLRALNVYEYYSGGPLAYAEGTMDREVWLFCDSLRASAIASLPEYWEALWRITRERS